jgi:hypothetical protein
MKRFFIGLATTILYTFLSMLLLTKVFQHGFGFNFGSGYNTMMYSTVLFTLLISVFLHAKEFLKHWQKTALDAEKFQRDTIAAKYENLKNKVNPHFLFNTLSALETVVYDNKDKAVKNIKDLSNVYRYILDTRFKEVVPVKDEFSFLKAFINLLKLRLGDSVMFRVDLPGEEGHVPPLVLQLLLESLLENMHLSSEKALEFTVSATNEDILLSFPERFKDDTAQTAFMKVVESIVQRYTYLSQRKPLLKMDHEIIRIELPIVQEYAS